MSETKPSVAEIRARLEAATPGPWKAEDLAEYGHSGVFWVSTDHASGDMTVAGTEPGYPGMEVMWSMNDAEFIAHAPTDVAFLLEENARLEGLLAEVKGLAGSQSQVLGAVDGEK